MILLLAGLLSFAPPPEAPRAAPKVPVLDVIARDGMVVLSGKDFVATAQRLSISEDGKFLDLRGTENKPATLHGRPGGPQTQWNVSGARILFSPGEGRMHVFVSGSITEAKPKEK